jgi:DNA-binding GntR family transcriptional regulator
MSELRQSAAAGRPGDLQRSLADVARDHIRQRITSGALPPGTRLKERDLTEELGISRIPIREALRELVNEGFVSILPRRGATVTALEPDDLREIVEVREALESHVAALAVRHGSDAEVAALEGIVARAELAQRQGDSEAVNGANQAFHDALMSMSHNTLVVGMLQPLSSRINWLLRQHADDLQICEEHSAIAAAVAARDAEAARQLAAEHVLTSRRLAYDVLFPLTTDVPTTASVQG